MDEEIKIEGYIDINEALEEFETKSNAEKIKKTSPNFKTSEAPKMIQLVMKWSGGAIKDERQAEYMLLVFVALMIIITIVVFIIGGSSGVPLSEPYYT